MQWSVFYYETARRVCDRSKEGARDNSGELASSTLADVVKERYDADTGGQHSYEVFEIPRPHGGLYQPDRSTPTAE